MVGRRIVGPYHAVLCRSYQKDTRWIKEKEDVRVRVRVRRGSVFFLSYNFQSGLCMWVEHDLMQSARENRVRGGPLLARKRSDKNDIILREAPVLSLIFDHCRNVTAAWAGYHSMSSVACYNVTVCTSVCAQATTSNRGSSETHLNEGQPVPQQDHTKAASHGAPF